MISITLGNAMNAIASLALVTRKQINSSQSINKATKPDTLEKTFTKRLDIQPFDTAFIAYQMMGLNDR